MITDAHAGKMLRDPAGKLHPLRDGAPVPPGWSVVAPMMFADAISTAVADAQRMSLQDAADAFNGDVAYAVRRATGLADGAGPGSNDAVNAIAAFNDIQARVSYDRFSPQNTERERAIADALYRRCGERITALEG